MREVATGKLQLFCPMREVASGKLQLFCPMREVATGKKLVISPMYNCATGKKLVISSMLNRATPIFLPQYLPSDLSESNYFVKTSFPFREGNTKFARIKPHEKTEGFFIRISFLKERNKKVFSENNSLLKREEGKTN